MQVRFPDDAPIYDGANVVIRFVAEVDNSPVVCAITAEALEDHFGAESACAHATRSNDHGAEIGNLPAQTPFRRDA